jgi:hypothetical protein
MKEDVLQSFWNPIWIQKNEFKSQCKQGIRVLSFGQLNHLQGPDFTGAEVEIDGVKHHGSIEIHVNSSHWCLHGHHTDTRYNQVVLHVVWIHDEEIKNQMGKSLPTIALSDYFTEKDLQKMQVTKSNKTEFICKSHISRVSIIDIERQLDLAAFSELKKQSEETFQWAESVQFDWERVLFMRLLGYSVDPQNRMNALRLAREIPLRVFRRYGAQSYMGWILKESGVWHASPSRIRAQTDWLVQRGKQRVFPPLTWIHEWQHRNLRPGSYPIERILQFLCWMDSRNGYLDKLLMEQAYDQLDLALQMEAEPSILEFMQGVDKENAGIFADSVIGATDLLRIKPWNYLGRSKLIQNAIIPVWGARRIFLGLPLTEGLLETLNSGVFELNRISSQLKWIVQQEKVNQRRSYGMMSQYKQFCEVEKCSSCGIGRALWDSNIQGD